MVKPDWGVIGVFEHVFERCGKLLVGDYPLEMENALFDLLLFV